MRLLLLLPALAVAALPGRAVDADELPPSELFSPDKTHSVQLLETPMPDADPEGDDYTLVLTAAGKPIGKFATQGYLIDAFWSPNHKYVAVDNRRANAGDYLWVLDLTNGHAVKIPDDSEKADDALVHRLAKKYPECASASYDKSLTVASAWNTAGELTATTRVSFDHVLALYTLVDTYKVKDDKLVLKSTAFEKKALQIPW